MAGAGAGNVPYGGTAAGVGMVPQVSRVGPPVGAPSSAQPMGSPTKEVNMASLCRIGQETVQEIVSKTNEIFGILKTTQLPNNTSMPPQTNVAERKAKLEENIKNLQLTFKKMRVIYDKIQEKSATLDTNSSEDLLPIEESGEVRGLPTQYSDTFKFVSEEHKEVVEQIQARNHQLKEIIDQLRTIIWEINTMMAMRKV